jgi:PAS domain S-box-containing protein
VAGSGTADDGDRRLREEALAGLARVLDALGAAAYVSDDHGLILAVNAEAERLLGRPADRLVGKDAHDLLHRTRYGETVARTRCEVRQATLAGHTTQRTGLWVERGDGVLVPMRWLVTPYVSDGLVGAVVLFHQAEEDESGPGGEAAGDEIGELERLALLAELTTQLTSTLDTGQALHRLVALVVPRLADWAVIDLISEQHEVWRSAVAHFEGGTVRYRDDLVGPMPPIPGESPMPLSRALRGAASTLAGPETYQGEPDSGIAVEQARLFATTGMHSAVIAPIRGLRTVLGALTLGRSERPAPFTAADLPLLEDITRRAGLALDNARLYQRQRKVSETMQRHLLPQLPRLPHVEMTARYLPAPDASQVGGDWYDAFVLPDGALVLVVGDVVGHDLEAAADMAQLRNMLRAYAHSQQEPPSKIVEWLDHAAMRLADTDMATLVLGRMTDIGTMGWELSWTNAGHPPPLLVTAGGRAQYLTDGHGMLLGTGVPAPRPDATRLLPPGATLVLYTDGLVEQPGQSIDVGLERLRRYAAALIERPLEAYVDELLTRTRPSGNGDDVAILALRTPAPR